MTCIVAVATPGEGVVLGADSLSGRQGDYEIVRTPKLYEPSPWLAFGFTTSWRFGQLLGQVDWGLRTKPADDVEAWLYHHFIPGVREALSDGGWQLKKDEREEGGEVVVAVRDRAFVLYSDYSLNEPSNGIAACGSGEVPARVAVATARLIQPELPAEELVRIALEQAESIVSTVRGPWSRAQTKLR